MSGSNGKGVAMHYETKDAVNGTNLKLNGELTFNDHAAFNDLIEELTAATVSSVECDLRDLEFIDSSGLGLLLLLSDRARKAGWSLTFSNPTGQVAKMLKYTEINKQLSLEE